MAGIEERSGSYRIHFRYHGKSHILTLGNVSEDEARSKIRHVWRFLTSISTLR
jgi:hypothetical protein